MEGVAQVFKAELAMHFRNPADIIMWLMTLQKEELCTPQEVCEAAAAGWVPTAAGSAAAVCFNALTYGGKMQAANFIKTINGRKAHNKGCSTKRFGAPNK